MHWNIHEDAGVMATVDDQSLYRLGWQPQLEGLRPIALEKLSIIVSHSLRFSCTRPHPCARYTQRSNGMPTKVWTQLVCIDDKT